MVIAPGVRRQELTTEERGGTRTTTNNNRIYLREAEINVRTAQIVDAAMKVHSALGPGLLESAYVTCLAHELRQRGLHVVVQVALPVRYGGVKIDVGYRIDMLVEDAAIVELKAVTKTVPLFDAQLFSYMKLSGHPVGLLINFHVKHLKDGIKRIVLNLEA